MKSRLLPPTPDARDSAADAAPISGASPDGRPDNESLRRESDVVKTFDEVSEALTHEMAESKGTVGSAVNSRQALQVSARPRGRLIVAAVLLACLGSIGYSIWMTFFRDAAYGVVTGKVAKISAPWTGTLTAVFARAGDQVRQGEILAVVEDVELQADIERLGDVLRTAQADLDAQAALIALAARERSDDADEVRASYFDLRGELLAEEFRHAELTSKLARRRELAHQRAYSDEEIESLTFVAAGLAAKIENLRQATTALKSRLDSPGVSTLDSQLRPSLAQIEATQAEIMRLRDKQRRGTIRAPFSGTVVAIKAHVGERVNEQPIVELLPNDSLGMVLYVKQSESESYMRGQQLEIVVDPLPAAIACKVTHIGSRLETPDTPIGQRHFAGEKLIPVHLIPLQLPSDVTLRIGSSLRLPRSLSNRRE
ncbi:MAG: HlyD family efflux transporter periplasmic adaptor subunit [Planctomycetota bacterium]